MQIILSLAVCGHGKVEDGMENPSKVPTPLHNCRWNALSIVTGMCFMLGVVSIVWHTARKELKAMILSFLEIDKICI